MTSQEGTTRLARRSPRPRCFLTLLAAVLTLGLASSCALADSSTATNRAIEQTTADAVPEIAALLPQKYKDSGTITVGAIAGLAPMMYHDVDGKSLVGIEAALMRQVGQVLGVNVQLEDVKAETFMTGIVGGRLDMAVGSVTYTPERRSQADFVVYAEYGQALATTADKREVASFDTLCGKSVAVLNGSIQQLKFLPELDGTCTAGGQPPIGGQVYPDPNSLFLAVTSGRADVAFLNEPAVKYQVAQSAGQVVLADEGLGTDPKGIVVGRATGLQDAVLAAVEHLASNGDLKQDFDKGGLADALTQPALNPKE